MFGEALRGDESLGRRYFGRRWALVIAAERRYSKYVVIVEQLEVEPFVAGHGCAQRDTISTFGSEVFC